MILLSHLDDGSHVVKSKAHLTTLQVIEHLKVGLPFVGHM